MVGLEEPREGGENDVSIVDGDFEERNDLDHMEEGPHWDDERRRAEEARRERGRHESEREYPMTNYFGSATPGKCLGLQRKDALAEWVRASIGSENLS